jgi:uncharacterized Zn finger protein
MGAQGEPLAWGEVPCPECGTVSETVLLPLETEVTVIVCPMGHRTTDTR